MQKVNYIAAAIMWIILAYLAYRYVGELFKFRSAPILSSIVLTIIYSPMAYWALREKRRYRQDEKNFKQGGRGEGAIYYELLNLPDQCLVFQDIKLPGKNFNIDFVVVGPTGLFAIEVKSHKGLIGFNGTELTKNGRPFEEGKPLGQTMQEALDLHVHLLEHTKTDYFIIPLLVFSNNKADVKFGLKPVKNVYVIKKGFLIEAIIGSKLKLSADQIENIKAELSKLVHTNRK